MPSAQKKGLCGIDDIYKSFPSRVDVLVGLDPCQVAVELFLLDEQPKIEGFHYLELQVIGFHLGNASNSRVKLIFIIKVIEVFGSDHDTTDEQSE